MNDEDFEKGMKLLLNQAYEKPCPDEKFRTELLTKLKKKQQRVSSGRKHRIIALYSAVTSVAAVFALAVIPFINPAIDTATPTSIATLDAKVNTTTPKSITQTINQPTIQPTIKLASLDNISGKSAQAINQIEVKDANSNSWKTLTAGTSFAITNGMEMRTPLGVVEPVSFAVNNGPSVMLDGLSNLAVENDSFSLIDGRAVFSLANTDKSIDIKVGDKNVALQPGAMAFVKTEESEDYAKNGSPAPVIVLLKGNATTLDSHNTPLMAGRVYEFFDTGTGRYPNRELGSYENQQKFMPMINAIQAANKIH